MSLPVFLLFFCNSRFLRSFPTFPSLDVFRSLSRSFAAIAAAHWISKSYSSAAVGREARSQCLGWMVGMVISERQSIFEDGAASASIPIDALPLMPLLATNWPPSLLPCVFRGRRATLNW
uniref:Putative secreted peptide n=1 Tax=Anopheles braziliensis TaxID=58242 RepID=A0A2M3ZXB1_9DIPT